MYSSYFDVIYLTTPLESHNTIWSVFFANLYSFLDWVQATVYYSTLTMLSSQMHWNVFYHLDILFIYCRNGVVCNFEQPNCRNSGCYTHIRTVGGVVCQKKSSTSFTFGPVDHHNDHYKKIQIQLWVDKQSTLKTNKIVTSKWTCFIPMKIIIQHLWFNLNTFIPTKRIFIG